MSPTAIFIHKLQLEINFIFKVSISINSSWMGKKFEFKAIQASGRIRIPWACQTTQGGSCHDIDAPEIRRGQCLHAQL